MKKTCLVILALVMALTLIMGSVSTASAAPVTGRITATANIVSINYSYSPYYGNVNTIQCEWSFTGVQSVYITLLDAQGNGQHWDAYSSGSSSLGFYDVTSNEQYTMTVTPLLNIKGRSVEIVGLAATDTATGPTIN